METKKLEKCPKCQSKMNYEWINFDKMILLCINEKCNFPLDQANFVDYEVSLPKKVKQYLHPELKGNKRPVKVPEIDIRNREKIKKRNQNMLIQNIPEFQLELLNYELRPIPDFAKLKLEKERQNMTKEEIMQANQLLAFSNFEERQLEQFCNMEFNQDELPIDFDSLKYNSTSPVTKESSINSPVSKEDRFDVADIFNLDNNALFHEFEALNRNLEMNFEFGSFDINS